MTQRRPSSEVAFFFSAMKNNFVEMSSLIPTPLTQWKTQVQVMDLPDERMRFVLSSVHESILSD